MVCNDTGFLVMYLAMSFHLQRYLMSNKTRRLLCKVNWKQISRSLVQAREKLVWKAGAVVGTRTLYLLNTRQALNHSVQLTVESSF
jgi:hypothetical protein